MTFLTRRRTEGSAESSSKASETTAPGGSITTSWSVAALLPRLIPPKQSIADREIQCLEILVDDILNVISQPLPASPAPPYLPLSSSDCSSQHSNEEEFALRVENNTQRYIKYFEEIADELMPASAAVERDVFDVLNVSSLSRSPDTHSALRTSACLTSGLATRLL
jgi:hypothetical protein